MSPRGRYRFFLTSLPFARRTTNNYSWTRYDWENPRTLEWGWSTPCTTETKTDCVRKLRGTLTALPLPQDRTASHREVYPEPSVPLVAKESRGVNQHTQHCGLLCGSPYCGLTAMGIVGDLQSSTTGNLAMIRERGQGLTTISTWILADWVHTCSA